MQLLVGGPARACNVFLVCDDRKKTWKFLRCIHVFDLVLKFGSDTNGRNWLKLLLHFFVMMGKNATVIGTSFLCIVSGFRLKFSRIALWRKPLQLDSKNSLTMNGLILGFFCSKLASFVDLIPLWSEFWKNCSIIILFDDFESFKF